MCSHKKHKNNQHTRESAAKPVSPEVIAFVLFVPFVFFVADQLFSMWSVLLSALQGVTGSKMTPQPAEVG